MASSPPTVRTVVITAQLTIVLFFVDVTLGASATITLSPQNVLALKDGNATLHCASDSNSSRIIWNRDGNIISTSCQSHAPDLFVSYVSRSTSGCDLTVLAKDPDSVAGNYVCDDVSEKKALAMLIVLSKSTVPSSSLTVMTSTGPECG